MIGAFVLIAQLAVGAQRQPPAIIRTAKVDPAEMVNVAVSVEPDTVYVGQQATYRVAILVDETFEQQLRRYPTLAPPDVREMLAYDLPLFHDAAAPRVVAGRRFDVHVYQRAIFPLTAGEHVIPGAQIEYAVPVTAGYFSRQETIALRADSVRLVVRDLPAAGQPQGFAGGVGRFEVSVELDEAGIRVGDPALVRVKVAGRGNVRLLPRPSIDIPWATLVAGAERVRLDTTSGLVSGVKEFDWVMTPLDSGVQTVPAVSYPFFDPLTGRYGSVESPVQSLVVASGAMVADDTAATPIAPLAVRREWRGPVREPLPTRGAFWGLVLLAPLPAIVLRVARRARPRRTPTAVDLLRDLARGAISGDAATARRAFVAVLAEGAGVTPASLGGGDDCVAVLRRAGVPPDVASRAASVLGELDRAAYAGGGIVDRPLLQRGIAAAEAVRGAVRTVAPALIAVVILGVVTALGLAQPPSAAVAQFGRGLAAYDAGDFPGARDAFATSAGLEVRAPDAWANYGTAAWMANDTAAAIAGWQRAVRLSPRAADVRRRLMDAGAFDAQSRGWVAALTVDDLAIPALALWVMAWGLAAFGSRRTARWAPPLGGTSLALGAAALAVAAFLSTRDLAVVAGPTALRVLPALGGEEISQARTGDLARVTERSATWFRVRMADGREGWIAATAAIPIWTY